jgi:hypothetical protein
VKRECEPVMAKHEVVVRGKREDEQVMAKRLGRVVSVWKERR